MRALPAVPALLKILVLVAIVAGVAIARADDPAPVQARTPSASRGLEHLVNAAYIPAMLDDRDFDLLWTTWPEPQRSRAEKADRKTRRRLAFARYGLTPRPGDESGKPLQFVVDDAGRWSINCFSCHTGALEGAVVLGLPNADFAFQDLVDDAAALAGRGEAATAAAAIRPWQRLPLGGTHGTTNAVAFSLALGVFRDKDLNLVPPKPPLPKILHHDLDAPPWWNVAKRARLYADGATKKSHRALMQFLMVPQNGPERFAAWEGDFQDILAYIESLPAPRWPHEIDRPLAERGRVAFEATCAKCHGTYGGGAAASAYPGVRVAIDVIGTDRTRFDAIPRAEREKYAVSWFTGHRKEEVALDPEGYVAPPLDGVWASAPYFHNGSAPTLWHVLHPGSRPVAWRRKACPVGADGVPALSSPYDRVRVGLDVETRDAAPTDLVDPWERRAWFDTTKPGKSAAGHTFPSSLSEDERRAVLEYLKTL